MNQTTSNNPSSKTALRHWKGQRITAALIVAFTLLILAQLIFKKGPLGYELWAGIFAPMWMRVLTGFIIINIAWHVWLGMCEIYMDYIKPVGIRSGLQIFTAIWLLGCVAWVIFVLWKF